MVSSGESSPAHFNVWHVIICCHNKSFAIFWQSTFPYSFRATSKIRGMTSWTKTRMPAFWGSPPPPASWLPIPLSHDYPYHWVILDPKSKEDKVKVTNLQFWNNHYMRHTFWSCLIRCANMKWIQWVMSMSGHDSVHRRTDGQTDKVKPVYPLSTSLKRVV